MNIIAQIISSHLGLLLVLSALTFCGSIIALPVYISRLPHDHFLHLQEHSHWPANLGMLLLLLLRNIVGALFLLAGIAMLFLPGQGLLTILAGLLLLSIPGKHHLITKLTGNRKIRDGLDWIRRKTKQTPFSWPPT